jgi:hypothetical protein
MYASEMPPPQIATNEQAMKVWLDHILEVASTMVDQYGGSGFKTLWDSLERQPCQGAKGGRKIGNRDGPAIPFLCRTPLCILS